jgi:hypothetical protein
MNILIERLISIVTFIKEEFDLDPAHLWFKR